MGPLGSGEIVFIFILALLLFGPKKLPELGRTVAKAMNEFRRAQGELKATFDREMVNLERETGIKELAQTTFQSDAYDYSSYDSSYYEGSYDSTVTNTTTAGASAIEGAGSAAPLQIEAAAGSIANGHLENGHAQHAAPADASATAHGQIEQGHATETHHGAPVEKPVNS